MLQPENMRKIIKLNASSYKGQEIMNKASNNEGENLWDVYKTWSVDKEDFYDWCYRHFHKTKKRHSFSICSHNSQSFTCSWYGEIDGEKILRYETKDNTYIVYLDK